MRCRLASLVLLAVFLAASVGAQPQWRQRGAEAAPATGPPQPPRTPRSGDVPSAGGGGGKATRVAAAAKTRTKRAAAAAGWWWRRRRDRRAVDRALRLTDVEGCAAMAASAASAASPSRIGRSGVDRRVHCTHDFFALFGVPTTASAQDLKQGTRM